MVIFRLKQFLILNVHHCAPFDGELIFQILFKTVGYLLSYPKKNKKSNCQVCQAIEQIFHLTAFIKIVNYENLITFLSFPVWPRDRHRKVSEYVN